MLSDEKDFGYNNTESEHEHSLTQNIEKDQK